MNLAWFVIGALIWLANSAIMVLYAPWWGALIFLIGLAAALVIATRPRTAQ
ncbi:hypothetical protein [Trebonia sp.]|uniref:hypothetical protein n=1 Tax=Trebonia sp. TaxID=2767075 RepID=UPI0026035DB5|nr:hypothetical protein [Trebonia sp.]